MSAGRWADRFTTWYHQRKAEKVLRKHGICPVHFKALESKLDSDGYGWFGWSIVCSECEKQEQSVAHPKDYAELKRAAITLLKGKKNVAEDSSAVLGKQGD